MADNVSSDDERQPNVPSRDSSDDESEPYVPPLITVIYRLIWNNHWNLVNKAGLSW